MSTCTRVAEHLPNMKIEVDILTKLLADVRFVIGSPCRYLNAIQTMCPHILRYLTTAVITNKDVRKRRQVLKDLVKVIQQVRGMGGGS